MLCSQLTVKYIGCNNKSHMEIQFSNKLPTPGRKWKTKEIMGKKKNKPHSMYSMISEADHKTI